MGNITGGSKMIEACSNSEKWGENGMKYTQNSCIAKNLDEDDGSCYTNYHNSPDDGNPVCDPSNCTTVEADTDAPDIDSLCRSLGGHPGAPISDYVLGDYSEGDVDKCCILPDQDTGYLGATNFTARPQSNGTQLQANHYTGPTPTSGDLTYSPIPTTTMTYPLYVGNVSDADRTANNLPEGDWLDGTPKVCPRPSLTSINSGTAGDHLTGGDSATFTDEVYQHLPEFIYHNAGGTPEALPSEAAFTCNSAGTPALTCDTNKPSVRADKPFGDLTGEDYATAYTITGCTA